MNCCTKCSGRKARQLPAIATARTEANNAAAARISAADDAKSLKGRSARTAGAGTSRAKAEVAAVAAEDRAADPAAAAEAVAEAAPVTKPNVVCGVARLM